MDDSDVAALLFPGEAGLAKWCSDSEYSRYLSELTTFTVDRLRHEPERLGHEHKRMLQETQDLAFRNYKGFIQTAECSRQVAHEFVALNDHIGHLLQQLPVFGQTAEDFVQGANTIAAQRRLYLLTLQHHTQLLEILEIPQLMDTCVRNGYYEEALDLEAYVQRLGRRHGDILVVQSIVQDVQRTTRTMLGNLLQLLRTDISLAGCLRVVGHLRRLGVFGESELRIKFVHARQAWLQTQLRGLDPSDPYSYINRTVDAMRVCVADIVSQYRAIFPEDGEGGASRLLHGWVAQATEEFIALLKPHLPRVTEGALLNSLLGQCMFLGMALGRVGLDFRALLPPLFESVIADMFTAAITNAAGGFVGQIESDPYGTSTPWVGAVGRSGDGGGEGSSTMAPPSCCLEYTALALLANAYCEALNNLRHCAPLPLAARLQEVYGQQLSRVSSAVGTRYHQLFEGDEASRQAQHMARLAEVLALHLLPFLCSAFHSIYPLPPPHMRTAPGLDARKLAAPMDGLYTEHSLQQLLTAAAMEGAEVHADTHDTEETGVQAQAQADTQADTQTEADTQAEADAHAEAHAGTQGEGGTQGDMQAHTQDVASTETEGDTQAGGDTQVETETDTRTHVEARVDTPTDTQTDTPLERQVDAQAHTAHTETHTSEAAEFDQVDAPHVAGPSTGSEQAADAEEHGVQHDATHADAE